MLLWSAALYIWAAAECSTLIGRMQHRPPAWVSNRLQWLHVQFAVIATTYRSSPPSVASANEDSDDNKRVLPGVQPLCCLLKFKLSKCYNGYKLTCSSPVQLSVHPPRPKSTTGPGHALYAAWGGGGWWNPDSCDATADARAGVQRTGQMGRGCVNKGQSKQEWRFCQSSEDLWVGNRVLILV